MPEHGHAPTVSQSHAPTVSQCHKAPECHAQTTVLLCTPSCFCVHCRAFVYTSTSMHDGHVGHGGHSGHGGQGRAGMVGMVTMHAIRTAWSTSSSQPSFWACPKAQQCSAMLSRQSVAPRHTVDRLRVPAVWQHPDERKNENRTESPVGHPPPTPTQAGWLAGWLAGRQAGG